MSVLTSSAPRAALYGARMLWRRPLVLFNDAPRRRAAFAIALLAHSVACAPQPLPPAQPPTSALRQVRVEGAALGVAGVVHVDGRPVCRLPCTVLVRPSSRVEIDLEAPADEQLPLPPIPPSGIGAEPARVIVHPASGHPTAGGVLIATGSVLAVVFGVLAAFACSSTRPTGEPQSTDGCPVAGGFFGVSVGLAVLGVALVVGSSPANAAVLAPSAPAGARLTPRGLEMRF